MPLETLLFVWGLQWVIENILYIISIELWQNIIRRPTNLQQYHRTRAVVCPKFSCNIGRSLPNFKLKSYSNPYFDSLPLELFHKSRDGYLNIGLT